MAVITIVISVLALLISALNFWWTQVRSPRKLYWVRVDKLCIKKTIDFALVNSGKTDVLICEVLVSLSGNDPSRFLFPSVEVHTTGSTNVVAAGKVVEVNISFEEPVEDEFLSFGRKEAPWPDAHSFLLSVELAWIDHTGATHRAKVEHSRIALSVKNGYRGFAPAGERFEKRELYAEAAA